MDLFQSQIQPLTEQVCDDSKAYRQIGAGISVSDLRTQPWRSHLDQLRQALERGLSVPQGFTVTASQGAGFYPFIKWICFAAPGQKVSSGVFVAVCFDADGKGLIAGLARSVTNPPVISITTQQRTPLAPGNVDVDSASKHGNVKFNDTFHSPKEFFRDSFSATDLITHLQESL